MNGGIGVKKQRIYYYLHLCHGLLILFLLLTGAVLYFPSLRTFFHEIRWEMRQLHAIVGVLYFLLILVSLPYLISYLRGVKIWTKTFHVCLQITLAIGWTSTGIFLWINQTMYLGLRQTSIVIHDILSLFIVPWVISHISLWYFRKKGYFRKRVQVQSGRDRGWLISRRDVLVLFSGALITLTLGALVRWYQPLSERFLTTLDQVKKRGYFRIYSVRSDDPVFDPLTWRLVVDGFVKEPVEFGFDELKSMPQVNFAHDFHCVTGWSVLGVSWRGVTFQQIVEAVKPTPEGVYVKMYSSDKIYTETFELSQLLQQNVILAHELDGKPLIQSQGAPLRLFHPDMYGYKSIKWVERIEFTNVRDQGYWEEKEGYDLDGYIT
jgi:hypothetical protein